MVVEAEPEVLSQQKSWDLKYSHLTRFTPEEILTQAYLQVLKEPEDVKTLEIRRGMIDDSYEIFLRNRVDAISPEKIQDLLQRGVLENWIATSIDRLKGGLYKRPWSYDALNHFKELHWTLRRTLEIALPKKEYLAEVAAAVEETQQAYPSFDGTAPTIAQYRLMNRALSQAIISRIRRDPSKK